MPKGGFLPWILKENLLNGEGPVLFLFCWMKCESWRCFKFLIQGSPKAEWAGCGVPCPRSHRAVCWLLEGSAVCRWDRTGQDTHHSCLLGSGSHVAVFAEGVALCCACIQAFTHFPHLGWFRQPGQAKDFVCVCSFSSPLPTHGLDIHVSLTLDLKLHSASSDFLQKSLFNTWLPHLVWPYTPWRHTCFTLMGCELPGAWRLWEIVNTAVLCVLGSEFWQPDLTLLLLSLVDALSSQDGLSPRCWEDAPVPGCSESFWLSKSKYHGTSWDV